MDAIKSIFNDLSQKYISEREILKGKFRDQEF